MVHNYRSSSLPYVKEKPMDYSKAELCLEIPYAGIPVSQLIIYPDGGIVLWHKPANRL